VRELIERNLLERKIDLYLKVAMDFCFLRDAMREFMHVLKCRNRPIFVQFRRRGFSFLVWLLWLSVIVFCGRETDLTVGVSLKMRQFHEGSGMRDYWRLFRRVFARGGQDVAIDIEQILTGDRHETEATDVFVMMIMES